MGRIVRRTEVRSGYIKSLLTVVCVGIVLSGCSTASWVIHHNKTADVLVISEADVDAMIDELSTAQPSDSSVVLYNKDTDRYELTPDTYKKAIRDGIIRRVQDRKIREFLDDYRPEKVTDALRKDMGTAGFIILVLGVLGSLFY
jgi:hypothetical protein